MAAAVGAPPRYFPAATVPGDGDLAALTGFGQALRKAARHAEHPLNAALAVESLVLQLRRAWRPQAAAVAGGAFATLGR